MAGSTVPSARASCCWPDVGNRAVRSNPVATRRAGEGHWPPPSVQKHQLDWVSPVRPLGFEPRTNGLRVHCSAVELETV